MITRADVIAEIYFDNSAGLYSNCHNYHGWGGIETDYDVVAKPVQVIRGSVTGPFKFTVICKPLSRWYLRQNSCFPELTGHALVFLKYDNNGQLVNDTDFSPGIIFGPSDGGIFRIKDGQVWIFGVAGHPSDGGVLKIEDGQVWWPNYDCWTALKDANWKM